MLSSHIADNKGMLLNSKEKIWILPFFFKETETGVEQKQRDYAKEDD